MTTKREKVIEIISEVMRWCLVGAIIPESMEEPICKGADRILSLTERKGGEDGDEKCGVLKEIKTIARGDTASPW